MSYSVRCSMCTTSEGSIEFWTERYTKLKSCIKRDAENRDFPREQAIHWIIQVFFNWYCSLWSSVHSNKGVEDIHVSSRVWSWVIVEGLYFIYFKISMWAVHALSLGFYLPYCELDASWKPKSYFGITYSVGLYKNVHCFGMSAYLGTHIWIKWHHELRTLG